MDKQIKIDSHPFFTIIVPNFSFYVRFPILRQTFGSYHCQEIVNLRLVNQE